MVTPAPLRGWDFSLGDSIRDEAWRCFGSPVHFSSHFSSSPFRLVVDVPRSTFRLTPSSVALYLRATIHGSPSGFQVQSLTDWSFSFVVMGWRRVVGARGEGSGRRGPLSRRTFLPTSCQLHPPRADTSEDNPTLSPAEDMLERTKLAQVPLTSSGFG
uniref:Uncharacterized protein n=1 Tax=Oryza sativa subsp. japonica TaxID=39947 RepID=Q6K7V8_ORYSJ|nr:hypothetical protein [Oryza sativa Japonica Group]BAD28671.1 hypothetical protein [Oryza sativa Japonica Group]